MNRRFGGPGFTRPENALKRADELENVGQKHAALQALHDIITSKKHRTWSKTYEAIMFKHIDLVVESKKRNYAKEALSSYRNMCQAVNIASLEEVIKYFLKKAGDKAEEAQNKASQAVTIDVEDLEEDASPEDMMLSYVSADKGKDRTDRELVTPWFRFLWEAYRSVLEILRINPKLEALYAMTATKAFHFCLQYKRNMEFRRLCDILRQHLTNQLKPDSRYRDSREATPESLQLHLETRFEQLKVACELDLWAEAFRSVEDIQQLILLAKKTPKQQMMATYYARLTQIFAKSENHTYHAYAWLKLFSFTKAYNKNMTPEDMRLMACSVLLATLSILPYDRQDRNQDEGQAEQEKERIMHMANILGFAVDSKKDYRHVLSRAALLSHTTTPHILGAVPADIRQLYDLLTSEFNPLELCTRLAPLFEKLAEFPHTMSPASPVKDVVLLRYVDNLKQVAILRLLKQLSEVYSTLKISSLASMVPFATMGEIESTIVDAVRYDYLQIRIDHRNGTLHFGGQQLESEKIRSHLAALTSHLSKAVNMIDPSVPAEKLAKRATAIQSAMERTKEEHKLMNARKIMIEKRKEEQETLLLEQEKEEERRRAQAAREAEQAEERRRREDALRREKERIEKELEEREYEEARALLEQTRGAKKGAVPGKAGAPMLGKDGEKLDKQSMVREALSERLKEQQEMERKLAKAGKQLDHLERARREEEIPYLEAAYQARLQQDKELYEEQQKQALAAHRAAWEADIEEKRRLMTMNDERLKFAAQIMARRQEHFKALQKEREKKAAERAAKKKAERDYQRRREFVRRSCQDVEDRVAELEEQQAREAKEREEREEAERLQKIKEQAERQRQREAEIEAKQRLERERLLADVPPARPSFGAPPAAAAAASGGGEKSAYVPAHRRAAGAPAAAAASAAPDSRDRDRDREWGGGGGSSGGGARPEPPRLDDRWGSQSRPAPAPAPAPASAAAPPAATAAPAPAAPAAGKFVPSRLRGGQPSGGRPGF